MLGFLVDWFSGGAADAGPEVRTSLENPAIPLSDPEAWGNAFGTSMGNEAGEAVSHLRALTISPLWRGIMMISGDVSKLPLEIMLRAADGTKEPDYSHTAYDRLHYLGKANDDTTSLLFWRQLLVNALLFNNGWAWLDWSNNNQLLGMYPLLPDRTTLIRVKGRKVVVTEVAGRLEYLPYEEVLHICGPSLTGLAAPDMVVQAREDFAQALAARKFTSKFFKNGCHAGGVLEVPPGTTPKAKNKVEAGIQKRAGNDNAFRTLVLRDGFKWHQTMVDPQKSQLTELTTQKVRDVANWLNMSPARLGVKESISYNSLEQERKDYHDTTLSYWLVGIKSETTTKILTESDRRSRRRVVDYNINALLWADAQTVADIGFGGVERGVLTADEVRAWWNFNALPDGAGSKPRVPLNTAPAVSAAEPATEPDAAPADDATRSAIRQVLADAVARCVTRWNIHAERAKDLSAWLEHGLREHDETCRKILHPAIEAGRACGILPGTPEEYFVRLRMDFKAARIAGPVDANALYSRIAEESP